MLGKVEVVLECAPYVYARSMGYWDIGTTRVGYLKLLHKIGVNLPIY
jgi:hypothetical protein